MRMQAIVRNATLLSVGLLLWSCRPTVHAAEAVLLTPTEGKPVAGELVKADTEKVVLRVGEGEAAKEVEFLWAQIKRMSNGLTREKVLRSQAQDHPEKQCADCKGSGSATCASCQGKGIDAKAAKMKCPKCGGTGSGACSCKEGRVPCNGPCLKRSEGNWVKGEGGLLWRTWIYPGGDLKWSERNIGEVIRIQDGRHTNLGKCEKCGGTTLMPCALCKGSGKGACSQCHGSKGASPPCPDCKNGKLPCAACKGTGLKP